jgi:transcriptional regulator with XRE-family HTH domain
MDLGGRIVQIRQALGLSQTELARRAGLNQPTLNRIESQETEKTSASNLIAIARALGVRVEDLVEDAQRAGDIMLDLGNGVLLLAELKGPQVEDADRRAQLDEYADRLRRAFPEAQIAVRPFAGHGVSTLVVTPPADRDDVLRALQNRVARTEERVDLLTRVLRTAMGANLAAAEAELEAQGHQLPRTESAR